MIKSSYALILGFALLVAGAFAKVLIPEFPFETLKDGIVVLGCGYFGKRVVQRHRSFNNGISEG